MYSFTSNIRFSEVDAEKNLTLTSLINYFQDCTIFHSESLGAGFEYLEPEHKAWVLNSWQVILHRLPRFGEKVVVSTWPYAFTTLSGDRNFLLQTSDGEILAAANSFWVFTDTATGRPSKLTPDYVSKYPLEPPYEMEYASRKIPLPTDYVTEAPFQITKQQLDTNNHVNNAQYIRMAEAYLPEQFPVGEFRAEYRTPAHSNDRILPLVSIIETSCTVVLADENQKPYTTVQFIRKGN